MKKFEVSLYVLFLLAIGERLSSARFVLYSNAWTCRSPLTRRQNAGKTDATLVSWHSRQYDIKFLSTSVTPPDVRPISTIKSEDRGAVLRPEDESNRVSDLYFIRPALIVDMDKCAKILANGFFKGPKTNWFTFQYEKLITYLSLEANFPRTQQERSRYEIFVACCSKTGEVWGLVEIDARGATGERTSKVYEKSGGSSYMCNLAVDERRQRIGIATSLVSECERQVKEWYLEYESRVKKEDKENTMADVIYNNEISDDSLKIDNDKNKTVQIKNKMSNGVCLKVRESNKAAVQMYLKLGYVTIFEEIEDTKNDENILLMRKVLDAT